MSTNIKTEVIEKKTDFEVMGNSMDDGTRRSIMNGDILSTVELPKDEWISEFKKGNVFVLLDSNGGLIVKEVIKYSEDTNEITCHSWNDNGNYPDLKLNIDNIKKVYCIEARIRNLAKNPRKRG